MKNRFTIVQAKRENGQQLGMVAHPDNNRVILSTISDYLMTIVDISQKKRSMVLHAHPQGASKMRVTPNGRYLITGGQSWDEQDARENLSCIKIWDLESWKLIRELPGHAWTITGLDISADLRYIISSGVKYDDDLKLWDLTTDTTEILASQDKGFRGCAISPDGTYYAYVEGIFDRATKEKVFDFTNQYCTFFQFASSGEFLLCGEDRMKGFYIVRFSNHSSSSLSSNPSSSSLSSIPSIPSQEITMQKFCESIGNPGLGHWHVQISPNNRYIIFACAVKEQCLVIVDLISGEIVESHNMEDHPELFPTLREIYRKNNYPSSLMEEIPLPLWESMTVSQDGHIFLGIANQIFIIVPEIRLSCCAIEKSKTAGDPVILNPKHDVEIEVEGKMYDNREYLQLYAKYNLPENEVRALLRIASIFYYGEPFLKKWDLVDQKFAFVKENHVIELDYQGVEGAVFPTPKEFPYLEIVRMDVSTFSYSKLPDNIHLFKNLRILDVYISFPFMSTYVKKELLPASLALLSSLEFIGVFDLEYFPLEMRNRVYRGAIISPLEVEAMNEWEQIIHQEIWHPRSPDNFVEEQFDEDYGYFISSNQHIHCLVIRYESFSMDEEKLQGIIDLTHFPLSSCYLKWLTHVEIPDLGLITFPYEILSWSKLKELEIYVSCLRIPSWLTKMPSLQKISVRGGSIIEIPLGLPAFCPQAQISWHPAYEVYYEGKTLSEIATLCNPSHDKNFHSNRSKLSSREKIKRKNQKISYNFLDLRSCNLSSFESIQEDLQNVTHLYLRNNIIQDVGAFPSAGEKLKVVDLGCNNLHDLIGLSSQLPENCLLLVDGNPLRSLCDLSRNLLERLLLLNFWGKKIEEFPLHPRMLSLISGIFGSPTSNLGYSASSLIWELEGGSEMLDGDILETIIHYYKETPKMLVNKIISNPTSEHDKIVERLSHEGGKKEYQELERYLLPDHPILTAIRKRLEGQTHPREEALTDYCGISLVREEAEALRVLSLQVGEIQVISLPNYPLPNRLTPDIQARAQGNHIIQIHLIEKKLISLPESIGHFTALQVLDLHSNQLTNLPESLGNVTTLRVIDLHSNQLTALPESLGSLHFLRKLSLQGNQLTSLPASIGHLSILNKLSLEGNRLTSLPLGFKTLMNLQLIPDLTYFNCSNNQLTSLKMLPTTLSKVKHFNVSNNALNSLHGLPRVIYLSKDKIPKEDEKCVIIDARNNCLENLVGLPSIVEKAHYKGDPHLSVKELYLNLERCLLLEGNSLRSLHGLPSQWFYVFIYAFYYYYDYDQGDQNDPNQKINRPHWHSTPAGVSIAYGENNSTTKSFVEFFLSPASLTLLEACFREFTRYTDDHREYFLDKCILSVQPDDALPSWHLAFDALIEYFHLSPLELAHQYIAHYTSGKSSMSEDAIGRLKHEGGFMERQLLENALPNPQEDPVVQSIQARLSVTLPNNSTLLL